MSHKNVALNALLTILAAVRPCAAQKENTFLIEASSCSTAPHERTSTGFRVVQPTHDVRSGIITALHGVAGCKVRAISDGKLILQNELRVVAVDVDSDLALLYSDELQNLRPDGFHLPVRVNWSALAGVNLVVWGHPEGITIKDTKVTVRATPLEPLASFLKTHPYREQILDRASPNGKLEVVSISGIFLPGHSGAPVIETSTGRVLAVANGGLDGGVAGINWAVRTDQIEWIPVDQSSRYQQITKLPVKGLFTFGVGSGQKRFVSGGPPHFVSWTTGEAYRPFKTSKDTENTYSGTEQIHFDYLTLYNKGSAPLAPIHIRAYASSGIDGFPAVIFYEEITIDDVLAEIPRQPNVRFVPFPESVRTASAGESRPISLSIDLQDVSPWRYTTFAKDISSHCRLSVLHGPDSMLYCSSLEPGHNVRLAFFSSTSDPGKMQEFRKRLPLPMKAHIEMAGFDCDTEIYSPSDPNTCNH